MVESSQFVDLKRSLENCLKLKNLTEFLNLQYYHSIYTHDTSMLLSNKNNMASNQTQSPTKLLNYVNPEDKVCWSQVPEKKILQVQKLILSIQTQLLPW